MNSSENTIKDSLKNVQNDSFQYKMYTIDQAFAHMTQPRPEPEQQLYVTVDEVLFYSWDAQCLSVDDEYREEYLTYVPHVFDLLLQTTDGDDIFDYLIYIENSWDTALKADNLVRQRASRVVEMLMENKEAIIPAESAR